MIFAVHSKSAVSVWLKIQKSYALVQARRHHRQLSMQDDRQDYNSQLRDVINAKQQQQLALACTKAQQKRNKNSMSS